MSRRTGSSGVFKVKTARHFVLVSALLPVVAGCATTAQQCDPGKVSDVFTAASCSASGGFEAHLAAARSEVEALRVEAAASRSRAADAEREAKRLVDSRSALQQKMASEKRDLDRLRLRLAGMRVESEKDRARQTALNEQLKAAEANLKSMGNSGQSAQEIAALEADIAARKEVIAKLSGLALQE